MKELVKLLSRRENEVFELINSNLALSIDAVRHLISLLDQLDRRDWQGVSEEYASIDEIETQADKAHKDGVTKIVQGAFYGGIREDILNILEKVDSIADSAKDAAKFMVQRKLSNAALDCLFESRDLLHFASSCLDTVNALKESIHGLEVSREEALKYANITEVHEEEADAIKEKVLRHLFDNAGKVETLDIIQIRDFVNVLDNVADYAEDAADQILVLLAKGYS